MKAKSPLLIIFTTVFLDLVGFGIVIPLVGLYGRHFGATGWELGLLGAIFSLMQFVFAPMWGALSDRYGRRPILLFSLFGSTLSYVAFGLADSFTVLLASRAFAGIFSANISAAQAYIADITEPKDRAKGMGLIGAAFGIGFTMGPPIGGIASAEFGLAAPGLIAAAICGLNWFVALFRLPESLKPELRAKRPFRFNPLKLEKHVWANRPLVKLLLIYFFVTFCFSILEQTFSLLIQHKFDLETSLAGYRVGLILMFAGVLGAVIQGGLIRRLVPKFGESKLLRAGMVFYIIGLFAFPFGPDWTSYYLLILPIAVANGLVNPNLLSLISRGSSADEQGTVFGSTQGLGSLARAAGPFVGLTLLDINYHLPFALAAAIVLMIMPLAWKTR